MIGPFCYHDITNNEDYKKYIKNKNKFYYFLSFLGVLTLLISLILNKQIDETASGFLAGAGTGLTFGSLILLYKAKRLLKDENKLKKDRIIKSDERNKTISNQSVKISLFGLLMIIYIMIIIGILYDPFIAKIMIILLSSFILFYNLAYKYYSHKL